MARLTANALADALRASRPKKPTSKSTAAAKAFWEQWLTDVGAIAAVACKDWKAFDRFTARAGTIRLAKKKHALKRD